MLELSPPEYLENLEEIDSKNMQSMDSLSTEASELFGLAEQTLWDKYGLKFGTKEWQKAIKAKLQIGRTLRSINRQQEELRKEILSKGIRELHSRLMARPNPPAQLTLTEAYSMLYGDEADRWKGPERDQRLLSVHDYLFSDSEHYIADPIDYLVSNTSRLRGLEELENLVRVKEWIRTDSKEIRAFRKLVKTLRTEARKHKDTQDDATSLQPLKPIDDYSESDLHIIAFLKYSLEMKRQVQRNPYQASVAVLVKALIEKEPEAVEAVFDVPEFHYTRMQTISILKDAGVYVPWENLTLSNADLGLDAWRGSSNDASSLQNLQGVDGLDHIRHDFGNLPVYTIDDATASELDDGISVEACPHLLDSHRRPTHWVHIHVADPTSTLKPDHEFSLMAKKRLSSMYFPEMTWPMLPFELIDQQGWSLGSSAGEGSTEGQKVLTFSARLDEDGAILESKIQAGVVHNVRKITYDMVDELLGQQKPDASVAWKRTALVWPTNAPEIKPAAIAEGRLSRLEDSAKADLEKLHTLGESLTKVRVKSAAVAWRGQGSSLQLHPRPLPPLLETPLHPHFFINEPTTKLLLPSRNPSLSSHLVAGEMVAEFMILAGKLAAVHLSQRNIAGPYRGQEPPAGPKSVIDDLLSRRDDLGIVDQSLLSKLQLSFQAAYFSASPLDHWPMGIRAIEGGYLRATSPLRRYTDLVAHWQIKSTLDPANPSKPPFSRTDVEAMLYQTERTTALRRRAEARAVQFWKLYTVDKKWKDALVDPTRDPAAAELLLNSLTAIVRNVKPDSLLLRMVANVQVPELGVAAVLQTSPQTRLEVDQRVRVDITGVILDEYSKLYLKLKQ